MSGGWPVSSEFSNFQSAGLSTSTSSVTALTISTSAVNTKNSYTQLTAATSGDITSLQVQFHSGGTIPINSTVYTDIAIGGAGSEKIIINNISHGSGPTATGGSLWEFPIQIPSGSRIAARFALSSSTTTTTTVAPSLAVTGYEGGYINGEGFSGVDSVGQANGVGTTLFSSSTGNVKGPYGQLTASTTIDYAGFVIGIDTPLTGSNFLIDLAVGSGGNEKVIYTMHAAPAGSPGVAIHSPVVMAPIPSGSRVAARIQCNAATQNLNLTLYGIYQ